MFLKSIRLQHFRCFTDLELSFESHNDNDPNPIRKSTIVLGDNGVGKSNLLKAIALVTAGRDALADLLGDPESWINVQKQQCIIDAVLVTADGKERELSLQINRGDTLTKVLDRARDSLKELEKALGHADRNYFVVGYGASRRLNVNQDRRFAKSSQDGHPRALSVATLFNPDAQLTAIEDWAMDLDYRTNSEGVSIIEEVLSNFLRGVTFSRIDKERGQLMFNTPAGEVPMSQLSDGYQNVAAWIGDLLYRVTQTFKDYKSPLSTRGLLLIDEVDLHLHPRWQRDLLDFIQEKLPNLQIVVTTHSPFTAQQTDKNELFYIEREYNELSIHCFAGTPKHLLLHQLILSDAFGIESDDSREAAEQKSIYSTLKSIENRTSEQQAELDRVTENLRGLPKTRRNNSEENAEHLALLRDIRKELQGAQP